jgi:HEAT repeat protein
MPAAVKTIIRTLERDIDWQARVRALHGLARFKDKTSEKAVKAALDDRDIDVIRTAIHTVRKRGISTAVPALLRPRIINSSDPNVRWALVLALDELGNTEAIEPLITLLADENWNVRNAAVTALVRKVDAHPHYTKSGTSQAGHCLSQPHDRLYRRDHPGIP